MQKNSQLQYRVLSHIEGDGVPRERKSADEIFVGFCLVAMLALCAAGAAWWDGWL